MENTTDKSEEIIEEELMQEVANEEASSEESQEKEDETSSEAPKEISPEDEDMKTKYLRLMADFQNYKKRAEKSKSEIHAFANEKIVSQLLDVLDNFDRALSSESDDKSFKEGINMIFNQLKDVLVVSGVTEINAENAEFDPNYHNAVMMEDSTEVESGKVSAVLQKGYVLNGKVIRPAMVKVAN